MSATRPSRCSWGAWRTALFALGVVLVLLGCVREGASVRAEEEGGPQIGDPEVWVPRITSVMLRRVTYERDERPNSVIVERAQAAAAEALEVTDESSRLGRLAGQSVLLPGDPQYRGNLGYRSEWQSEFHAEADVEYWYAASYYLPEDWNQGVNTNFFQDRIIFQFHEGTGGSPVFSLHVQEDPERFLVRRKQVDGSFEYIWSAPFQTARWYDFVFQVQWSSGDDGFFRVFLDQRLVHNYRGRTLADGHRVYTKWGVYGQPTRVLFDEVRIVQGSNGLQLVSPWPSVRLR